MAHVGFVRNSYEGFRRTGSFESLWHYGARTRGNGFWILAAYAIGEWEGVVLWISAVFLFSFMLRDFNYRGHGGSFLSARRGAPINQMYYGFLVGEWHENHHAHPQLARSGLAWWQLDVPYWIIRSLSACGAVVQYNSLRPNLAEPSSTRSPPIPLGALPARPPLGALVSGSQASLTASRPRVDDVRCRREVNDDEHARSIR